MKELIKKVSYKKPSKRNPLNDVQSDAGRRAKHRVSEKTSDTHSSLFFLWRDLQLQSPGRKVCRFWDYELREDLPRCFQKLVNLLKR